MNDAEELELLHRAWCKESRPIPNDLYRAVRRQTRLMKVYASVEILLALAFLVVTLWKAVVDSSPEFIVLAVGVWVVTVATLIYSFRNRAGTWEAAAQNTNEFLSLSIRRCHSALRATIFGLWLLLVQVLLVGSWHAWYWSGRTSVPSVATWLVASALPIGLLIALLTVRSQKQRHLRRLERSHQELMG